MVSPVFNSIEEISSYFETLDGKIIKVSSAFEKHYGFKEYELLEKKVSDFINIEHNDEHERETTLFLKSEISTKWGITKEAFVIKALISENREIYIFKQNYTINELFLFHDSYIDKLTGIQYRYAFNRILNKDVCFYIAIIKIKNFIKIPSYFGEDFADDMIIQLSNKFKNHFNNNDLYLLDSSSFCVLNHKKDYNSFSDFISHIEKTVNGFDFSNCKITRVLPIIDYSFAFAEGKGFDIFKKANMALSLSKEKSINKYILNETNQLETENFFDNEVAMLSKLKKALSNGKVIPFYQPIYCNKTKRINKYECLARIEEADGNILSPFLFIDIAKKYNLNNDITKAIIKKSFEYFEGKNIDFSINLSVQSLNDINMYYYMIETIENYKNPENVIFEVIENEAMPLELFEKNPLIIELRNRKCRFALDDFGSGYSNLSMLTYFNYDYLKIDGSLINNIHIDACYRTIKTIVELAHNHNVEVIAEWVKDKETQKIIEELDIDYSQGFYFGMPLAEILED